MLKQNSMYQKFINNFLGAILTRYTVWGNYLSSHFYVKSISVSLKSQNLLKFGFSEFLHFD